MINLTDTLTLASTKLRTRKVRTAVTVIIAGLIFGLIMSVVFITSGLESSLAKLGYGGLGERYLTTVHPIGSSNDYQNRQNLTTDGKFIKQVEQAHADLVKEKLAKAKELGVPYNPEIDDPSPVVIDKKTGQKHISEETINEHPLVSALAEKIHPFERPLDLSKATQGFDTKPTPFHGVVAPEYGQISYMPGGKDAALVKPKQGAPSNPMDSNEYNGFELVVNDDSMSLPYVTKPVADPSSLNAIPVIIPFLEAEKALGLKPLPQGAPTKDRLERIKTVRSGASGLTLSACYRSAGSQGLLQQALQQAEETAKNKDNADYQAPTVVYKLPSGDSCGAVQTVSDQRSAEEKDLADRQAKFQQAFDPSAAIVQEKLSFQVIGVSPSPPAMPDKMLLVNIAEQLFMDYEPTNWQIPAGYFVKLPEKLRPESVFGAAAQANKLSDLTPAIGNGNPNVSPNYRIEFASYDEAKRFQKQYACSWTCDEDSMFIMPLTISFTSRDIQSVSQNVVKWLILVLGVVATIILSSMVGRVIADSRRETAVFRAIGAKRIDINLIYLTYTIIIALIIITFVLLLGLGIALTVNALVSDQITATALIATGAQDLTQRVSFIGFTSPYLLILPLSIIIMSLLAVVLPLLLNVRRNPIHDMRQE